MSNDTYTYGETGRPRFTLICVPLVLVLGLIAALVALTWDNVSHDGVTLEVYVAAGIRPPVEEIAAKYEQEGCLVVHPTSPGPRTAVEEATYDGRRRAPALDLVVELTLFGVQRPVDALDGPA